MGRKVISGLELGRRLALIRGRMTQEEFAKMFNVAKDTLARYERGEYLPKIDFVHAVCDAFGVSSAWLLAGTEPMLEQSKHPKAKEEENLAAVDETPVERFLCLPKPCDFPVTK